MRREGCWSLTRKRLLGALAALLLCAVAAPRAVAVTITYDIQAYIDYHDVLVIRADEIYWHHLAGAAVGRWGGGDEPTIISTEVEGAPRLADYEWTPEWSELPPAEIRYEDVSEPLPGGLDPALPATEASVAMTLVQARDRATLKQLPTAANNHTLMIEFIDEPNRSSWYHIILTVECQSWFPDVPAEHWAVDGINACVNAGIVSGYEDGLYHPDWSVTRAQMAVFISRSICTPTGEAGMEDYVPPESPTFEDVPTGHWAYKYVEYCVENDIVEGVEPTLYAPSLLVGRDAMAVFVSRAAAGGDDNVPDGPAEATFSDVPTDHWAYKYVEYCFAEDIVQGFSPTIYGPNVVVTRDQMAVFIYRAFDLPL